MSLNIDGASCAYCKAYLFQEDDVVFCPICGAPHHRACYNESGHCALEELHGTDKEYSRAKQLEISLKNEEEKTEIEAPKEADESTTKCRMCGETYPFDKMSCPKCGAPNFSRANGSVGIVNFDFLGGIPKDREIEEGITADDARKFVMSNTHRYIPKFVQLNNKKKVSWNWMAFLFPSCWALSRKLYKVGIISGVLLLVATLLAYPFYSDLILGGVYDIGISNAELATRLIESFRLSAAIIAIVGFAINIATRIITAMFGDWWYKKYTVSSIKKIREESHDAEMDYRKKGGVNIFLFLVSYFLLSELPKILLSLI